MLSNDEEYGSEMDQGEKHRIRREGSQTPGAKCLTGLDANLECTYQAAARKRLTKSRYVVDLETRLEHSEALIRQLCNELARLRAELATARSHNSTQVSSSSDESNHAGDSNALTGRSATLHILRMALRTLSAPPPAPHAEDLLDAELESKMDQLSMNTTTRRFLGKGSDAALIKAAIDLKADVRRQEPQQTEPRRFSETMQVSSPILPFSGMSPEGFPPNLWNPGNGHDQEPLSGSEYWDGERDASDWWTTRRPQYWMCKPVRVGGHRPAHACVFLPPPDLAAELIDLYFTRAHIYLPLLHRQTFDRNVETGVHHWDNSFAVIVLLVCAIGSRWSNDPRVLSSPGPNGGGTAAGHLHCGWEWFNQVPPAGKHLFGQGTLYDLQYYCLAVHFLLGSSAPQACWMLVGVGLRLAQDAGAHRRTSRVEEPSVERELWKRAFWVLVYLDGYVSSLMGRTCGIQYDDFDIEPIIECDDEYWEHPTRPFEQPAGVPSRIAFFNALLRLSHILECTLKILYSLGKVRARLTIDHGWEERFVADLDSALNRWRDQIPEHRVSL
ncbi:fungal-specific transcription factor domain-containing protein [Mycena sp. CBHHK59/15]|nr:fungal-specific transcription factor domain-containing protein [Mycena sp. CBHHK59/15]